LFFQVELLKTLMIHTAMTQITKGKTLYGLAVEMKKDPKGVVMEQSGNIKVVEVAEAFRTRGRELDVRSQQAARQKG
jgi:hypothetical protein